MAVRAPADKRFRRARVKPARKSRVYLRRLVVGVKLLMGIAFVGLAGERGYALATSSPLLRVQRVEVTGTHYLAENEINAVVDGLQGRNVLLVNLSAWRERLRSASWVKDAQVRRVFPSTVAVAVRERRPIALARLDGELFLIDEDGVVTDEFSPRYAELDLPIVDGLTIVSRDSGLLVDPERAQLAARVTAALAGTPLLDRLSQLDVSDKRDAVARLTGDQAVLRLGSERFAERLRSYLELVPRLKARVEDIEYVDLRFDERVYVRPVNPERVTARLEEEGRLAAKRRKANHARR
ncbi:MAG: FtsQ-type POTRA domain-containing protein [Luteitalea sp.]|nr:FtsQ-type POTRA domain-containing protein [Luteitalea sp.]